MPKGKSAIEKDKLEILLTKFNQKFDRKTKFEEVFTRMTQMTDDLLNTAFYDCMNKVF